MNAFQRSQQPKPSQVSFQPLSRGNRYLARVVSGVNAASGPRKYLRRRNWWAEGGAHTLRSMRKTISLLAAGAVLGASGAAIAKDPAGDHEVPDRVPVLVAYSSTAAAATVYFIPNNMNGGEVSVAPLREPRTAMFTAYPRGLPLVDFEATYKLKPRT